MASSAQYSLSHFTFLIFSISILLLISPSFSTSRHILDHPNSQTGFRVPLKHVDSDKNYTKLEHMQRALVRGKHRLKKLNRLSLSVSVSELKSPIRSLDGGQFVMDLAIGTPPESYSAILDTGSDLIWTQCQPCKKCFDQPTPVFDPEKSSSFTKLPCFNPFCQALPESNCTNDVCEYFYSYGDSSSSQGVLGTETFTFGEVSVTDIAFGCGFENGMKGFNEGAGLVGLGRSSLSLVSQLEVPKFSYCLTSLDDHKTSALLMGSLEGLEINIDINDNEKITTPLIRNYFHPSFYYVSLEGITIGDTRIPIDQSTFGIKNDGTGGFMIDSGTTITYLEQSVYDSVKNEFISQMTLPVEDSGSTGLDLCFKLTSSGEKVEIPKMVFNFQGGDLDLPEANYMFTDSSIGLTCLAMRNATGNAEDHGVSILGYFQQQNLLVIHGDLQGEGTLSFVPTECDKL